MFNYLLQLYYFIAMTLGLSGAPATTPYHLPPQPPSEIVIVHVAADWFPIPFMGGVVTVAPGEYLEVNVQHSGGWHHPVSWEIDGAEADENYWADGFWFDLWLNPHHQHERTLTLRAFIEAHPYIYTTLLIHVDPNATLPQHVPEHLEIVLWSQATNLHQGSATLSPDDTLDMDLRADVFSQAGNRLITTDINWHFDGLTDGETLDLREEWQTVVLDLHDVTDIRTITIRAELAHDPSIYDVFVLTINPFLPSFVLLNNVIEVDVTGDMSYMSIPVITANIPDGNHPFSINWLPEGVSARGFSYVRGPQWTLESHGYVTLTDGYGQVVLDVNPETVHESWSRSIQLTLATGDYTLSNHVHFRFILPLEELAIFSSMREQTLPSGVFNVSFFATPLDAHGRHSTFGDDTVVWTVTGLLPGETYEITDADNSHLLLTTAEHPYKREITVHAQLASNPAFYASNTIIIDPNLTLTPQEVWLDAWLREMYQNQVNLLSVYVWYDSLFSHFTQTHLNNITLELTSYLEDDALVPLFDGLWMLQVAETTTERQIVVHASYADHDLFDIAHVTVRAGQPITPNMTATLSADGYILLENITGATVVAEVFIMGLPQGVTVDMPGAYTFFEPAFDLYISEMFVELSNGQGRIALTIDHDQLVAVEHPVLVLVENNDRWQDGELALMEWTIN